MSELIGNLKTPSLIQFAGFSFDLHLLLLLLLLSLSLSLQLRHNHISLLVAHTSNSHKHCQQSHIYLCDYEKIRYEQLWKNPETTTTTTATTRNERMRRWVSEWARAWIWATSHKTIYQRKLELLLSVQETILFIIRYPFPQLSISLWYDNKFDGRRTRELF